ncbi:MAG: SufD family Fe-S cluster assembly protein [Candidatus Altiarchaeales archaeon]|nr:SufD family Fe-S cluster assembly protein [Candidatus Altiarchaeales archaeon]
MNTPDALKKYDWLSDYMWNLIDPETDETTKAVEENYSGGYFMRIKEGANVTFPLQSCLMISAQKPQHVHNIIISEPDSSARIITGCALHPQTSKAEHLGVSEIYVKENAYLSFTMIHNWASDTKVRPKSVTHVGENASFISNYVSLKPVADLKMYPKAILDGPHATAHLNSILHAPGESLLDVGSRVDLLAPETRGEIISRAIAKDRAKIIARGLISGQASPLKAHLECRGLLLSDEATIHAIPELVGSKKDVDLSHEAAVGKIADKEITYLMSRGLTEDEATSAIVRGFLDVDIMGLPQELSQQITQLVDDMTEGM